MSSRPRMPFRFPDPLYPIVDASPRLDVGTLANAILAGGAKLLQLRVKELTDGRAGGDRARREDARATAPARC